MSHRWGMRVMFVVLLGAGLSADTLVLRDGTRVLGELVSVRGSIIEFEESGGPGTRRIREFNRAEVARIEFEDRRIAAPPEIPRRPPGLRERLVMVASATPWTDSGITLRAGQEIYLESSGQVRWGRDRRDGPGGERGSPSNPNRPMPTRNAAALIGKIGADSTDLFFLGAETGPIRVRTSGRLFLGVNDDFLEDNTGSFRVIVYY